MKNKLLKVVAWRIISIITTFCVLALVTGNARAATGITVFLHVILTGCHLAFETLWERLVLKKDKQPDESVQ